MRYFLVCLSMAALTGCTAIETPMDDGYQFGDLTATPLVLQARYCQSATPQERAVRMVLLQRLGAPLPADGACADILELLSDEN